MSNDESGDQKALTTQALLQATLNVIPAYAWYAASSGGLTFVNCRTADYLGLPQDHPLRFGIDIGAKWDAHIPLLHPDDHEETRKVWATCLRLGEGGEVSFRVRSAQGDYRWFLSRAEPLRAGDGTIVLWVGVNLEIEELKSTEKALRLSEAWLTQAQTLSRTGSWVFDATAKRFLYWSDASYQIWGFDPLQGIPSRDSVYQRIHPEDRDGQWRAVRQAVLQQKNYRGEFRILLPDGTIKYIETSTRHLFSPLGTLVEATSSHLDVTERRRAQDAENELRKTQARLSRASQAATVAELSASIAHEINQPLAGIVASAQTCRTWLSGDNPNLPRAQAAIERIIRDGNAAADIVRRIRALFKQTAPAKAYLNINAVIEEVGRLTQDELNRRGVSMELELAQALLMVPADRIQIQQVLINLIRNGAEAMECAEAAARRLVIRSQCTDDCAIVEVCDHGSGLAHPEKIFEPFYSTKPEGLGVGLAISRSIVQAHDGTLRVRDNQPKGTVFSLSLPLRESRDEPSV